MNDHREHFVYPGQAIVSAWAIMHEFNTLTEASAECTSEIRCQGLCKKQRNKNIWICTVCGKNYETKIGRCDVVSIKRHGFCEAEGCNNIPGAGGIASYAIEHLKEYAKHRNISNLIANLQHHWLRLTGPGSGNHEKSFLEGLQKALKLENEFYSLVRKKEEFFK